MTIVRIFIPHDVVFPGQPSSFDAFRDLLRTLSRTDVLITCARFSHTLENRGHHDDHFIQNRAARRFLGDEQLGLINAWARRERRTPNDTAMFFRGQMLDLICWAAVLCDDLPGDGHTFESAETRLRFVRGALMISDAWGANVYADLGEGGSPDGQRVRAAAAFRRAVALSSSRASLLEAIARSASIYGADLRREVPKFEEHFSSATGLNFHEYLALAGALAMLSGARSADVLESNSAILHASHFADHFRGPARDKVPAFLDMLCQSQEQLAAALHQDDPSGSLRWSVQRTYRAIRDRPILRTADGRMIVLDPEMMCDALTMGPLFAAVRVAARGFGNTLFGAFGDAVESYVATLLTGMYPASAALVPRLILGPNMGNRQQRREVCDAILHGVDAIAVFEVKGVFIADVNVVARAPAIFRAEVLKQYAAPASKGSRRKGVTQLALAVGALSSGETDLDALRRGTTIYPVLVTLDSLVSAPGTVDILREAFAGALGATSKTFPVDVNGMRVACLTIMTVGDVELLDHLVATSSFSRSCACTRLTARIVRSTTTSLRTRLLTESRSTVDRSRRLPMWRSSIRALSSLVTPLRPRTRRSEQ